MRLSLPSPHVFQASAALVAIFGAISCTPQQVVIEKPCPPIETPALPAPTAASPANDAAVPRTLEVRLSPVRNDAAKVIAVDVAMRFSVPPIDFGSTDPFVLHLDPNIAGAAIGDRIDDLSARDSEGSLALRRVTETEKDKPSRAEWKADRRPRGPVTLSYRVQLLAEDAGRDEILASGGGLVALGRALFLMPATTEAHSIRVSWDLQGLGPGATGTSNFGVDIAEIEGAPTMLENAIWAAGPLDEITIRSNSTNGNAGRFRLVSLGQTALDISDVGPWANRVWSSLRPVSTNANQIDIFLRSAEKPGSLMTMGVFGPAGMVYVEHDVKFGWPEKLRLTEGMLRAIRNNAVMNQRWFDQGFGTFLALDTLRQTGLGAPLDVANEITKRADRYFASEWLRSPLNTLSSATNVHAHTQIEDRGFLLAADLDSKIRSNSAGKRSLVDFIRALEPASPSTTDSVDIPKATWISESAFSQALEKELGAAAVTRYRSLVESASALGDVPDDAFGPCFKKVKKKIQREDPATKKRESVDGFAFSLVPKLPPSCANVAPAAPAAPVAPQKR